MYNVVLFSIIWSGHIFLPTCTALKCVFGKILYRTFNIVADPTTIHILFGCIPLGIAFVKDLNLTICVDVRYVLWCVDKLGGAKNLIEEINPIK